MLKDDNGIIIKCDNHIGIFNSILNSTSWYLHTEPCLYQLSFENFVVYIMMLKTNVHIHTVYVWKWTPGLLVLRLRTTPGEMWTCLSLVLGVSFYIARSINMRRQSRDLIPLDEHIINAWFDLFSQWWCGATTPPPSGHVINSVGDDLWTVHIHIFFLMKYTYIYGIEWNCKIYALLELHYIEDGIMLSRKRQRDS